MAVPLNAPQEIAIPGAAGWTVPLIVMPPLRSARFTTSLPATAEMVGGGNGCCTKTVAEPVGPALPTSSVARAVMVVLAPGLATVGKSPAANPADQWPLSSAVTVREALPQLTATLAPASLLPPTVTPLLRSSTVTRLSPSTAAIAGAAGAWRSTSTSPAACATLPTVLVAARA
jgi:hypothetical protein